MTDNDNNLDLSEVSLDIWAQKYQLKGVDKTPADTLKRVADFLGDSQEEKDLFLWAMCNGAIPAGRILSNAGAGEHKPNTSLINCTVSGTIDDSMVGIMDAARDAALTLKAGCGIGYEFSTLRPSGAHVRGSGSSTSGPLPFMDIFDAMCKTVSSAGGRRGAQMATFSIDHPDVEAFIDAKREPGRLRQFNLSLLVTDDFMDAVREGGTWDLVFPLVWDDELELKRNPYAFKTVVRMRNGKKCLHRVYKTVSARELWDKVMRSTYDYAEPGVLFIDTMNQLNPLGFMENIRATNPCGEQSLPPNGACLLGSIDLTHFVENPFSDNARFDMDKLLRVAKVFTDMLDRVADNSGLPMEAQREEIIAKRRHGMGITGLGSALTMMGIRYGSKDSIKLVSRIMRVLVFAGFTEGVRLAQKRGPAPVLDTQEARSSYASSRYIKRMATMLSEQDVGYGYNNLQKDIEFHGMRFTHHTSIAPAGTISLSFGNNCSNGIEPTFAHEYTRNVIVPGEATKRAVTVQSKELRLFRQMFGDVPLPDYFITADDVTPDEHLEVMAAAQWFVDSSISKTINVPTDIPFDDFKDIYLKAWQMGCKGCTTFRFNPDVYAGVLVRVDDMKKTRYTFTLADGTEVTASGDEQVVYEGKTHTAANLHDAIKDGYYGKL